MPSLLALGLLAGLTTAARADPPLPGCVPHLADKPPACGDPGRNNRPTDGCCPNSCSYANDKDCCTGGDQVCLDSYGCTRENDSDCCTSGDKVCRKDLGCDESVDSDCKPGSGATGSQQGGCTMAGTALPPLVAIGLLLLLGLVARRQRAKR